MKLNAAARIKSMTLDGKTQFEVAEDPLKVTVTIGGEREKVERVLALLYLVYRNGEVGHSGTFGIGWDGDGNDKIDLEGMESYKDKFHDLAEALSSYGGDAEIVGEGGTGFIMRPGHDEAQDYHYVKSTKVFPKDI